MDHLTLALVHRAYRMRGYPIDHELRRAHRAQRGRRFRRMRALAARLSRKERS